MANYHMKILSVLLDIRKMQSKIKWDTNIHPLEQLKWNRGTLSNVGANL